MINRFLLLHLIILLAGLHSVAQGDNKQAVMLELNKLFDTYKNSPALSVDLAWYSSPETDPDNYIDSLKGQLKLNGTDSWYSLDSTESLTAGGYTIVLFKEDGLMYLNKPSAQNGVAPSLLMDSMLLQNKDVTCSMRQSPEETVLIFQFKSESSYKLIEYIINRKTGFLTGIKSIVKSEHLYDASFRELLETKDSYSCIEVKYSNYQINSFDKSLLDVNRYFKKEGEEYIPIAPFDQYKIFLGSPNL